MALRRMPGVAKRAVDQRNVILTFTQDGYRDAMAPVQIAFLATVR